MDKLFVDNGTVATVEEASERLSRFRMHIFFGEAVARCATGQAALLTAVNCGSRTFLGGVTVSGCLDVPLLTAIAPGTKVSHAVANLGGRLVETPPQGVPLVATGAEPDTVGRSLAIRAAYTGWRAGVGLTTLQDDPDIGGFAPSGVLAERWPSRRRSRTSMARRWPVTAP